MASDHSQYFLHVPHLWNQGWCIQVNSQTEKFRRQEVTKGPASETLVIAVSSNEVTRETAQMGRPARVFPALIHKVLKTQTKI